MDLPSIFLELGFWSCLELELVLESFCLCVPISFFRPSPLSWPFPSAYISSRSLLVLLQFA